MTNHIHAVEIIPEQNHNWFRLHKVLLFSFVFGLTLTIGLIFVFIRAPIFVSQATLLTVAPASFDGQRITADLQHILIQKQILTGQPLMEKTLTRIKSKSDLPGSNVSVDEMRSMLNVISMAETNLVKIQAQGHNPHFLQLLINSVLEEYLQIRAESISETIRSINTTLNEELNRLEEKIQIKRDEINQFRQHNDILSTDPNDNQSRARLQILNDSLNKESEKEVKAKARLKFVKLAIVNGKLLVPQDQKKILISWSDELKNYVNVMRNCNAYIHLLISRPRPNSVLSLSN